ncbi:hypothetical protein EYC84_008383 [Monilinia fructicola]|uniref:Uncharacterized protein n=1 Tax=Monilinia fructicola TaxID=38448 RepID=A0A5M9JH12_MONFR|nr:hypothetical protein EYC84_008383 [Monilinia fructicola]
MSPIQSIDLPKLGEASIARRRSSALAGIHLMAGNVVNPLDDILTPTALIRSVQDINAFFHLRGYKLAASHIGFIRLELGLYSLSAE